jgi:hypothetical protein
MRRCKKCKQIWCYYCAKSGKGHYPQSKADNRCPYCGTIGEIESS